MYRKLIANSNSTSQYKHNGPFAAKGDVIGIKFKGGT